MQPKLIQAVGQPGPLMVVGDYPTQKEYNSGYSFSGSSGTLLQSLFQPFGLSTKNLYKTHYFKLPVPGWSAPNVKARKEALAKVHEIENWDLVLKEEIEAIEPNGIVACGELALRHLTEEEGITKWRGSILHLHPRFQKPHIKVFPIYSPRDIWSENEHPMVYSQWDAGRIVKYKDFTKRFEPSCNVWIARNPDHVYEWWKRAERGEFLTLDIETHHGFITCIGFSHNGHEAVSIPLLVGPHINHFDRGRMYALTDEILRSKIPKVNQNIKYDWTVLETFGFDVANIVGDTMLMAHTIYPELPVGLDFLNSIYTDHPYYKDEGKKFDPRQHSVDRLLMYNARDALVTWQIWKQQLEDAEAQGVKKFYFKYVHPTFFIYKKLDQTGVLVDDSRRKSLLQKYEPMLAEIQQTINLVAEERINVNSPTQVARLLYDILGCPKMEHVTKTGKKTANTDEDSIEELYVNKITDSGRKSVLKYIIVARKIHKVIQFLTSPVSPDGRMRTSYKLHGTETGRTSAGKSIEPSFYVDEKGKIRERECGGSFQTIGKHGYQFGPERIGADLRSIFVPRPGWCFVEGDQGQAEDRVVCVLAEDFEGLEVLNKKTFKRNKFGLKDDRHTLTAVLITGKEFDEITPDDRQERGKKPRHAGNYNMGSYILSVLTHLPQRETKILLERFHSTNPNIRHVFHSTIKQIIDKHRYLVTPHGRRRDFFGRITEETYKQAFATIPQATVSDHNKFTILGQLAAKWPLDQVVPISESHDSNTFEVRMDIREPFITDFHRAIETPISFRDCIISRDVEIVIPGDVNWSDEDWSKVK
jgi:uracil-DNA glycosylase family 4